MTQRRPTNKTFILSIHFLSKNTYFSRGIVWHHLEMLSSKGECLRIERGDIDVYHLNEVINPLEEFDVLDNNSDIIFHITLT